MQHTEVVRMNKWAPGWAERDEATGNEEAGPSVGGEHFHKVVDGL